jgi:hypothetical protein
VKRIYAVGVLRDANLSMGGKVEQRVTIKFLSNEGANATKIHCRLLQIFQKAAHMLSSVSKWIRSFKKWRANILDDDWAGQLRLDHINSQIMSLFQKNELHSVGPPMQELSLSLSMGHAGLPDVLEFALRDTW